MIEVSLVPTEYVDTCWSKVEKFIEKAAKYTYGRYTTSNIYDIVKEGDYQLWVAFEGETFKGAVVTNIMNYPQKKILCMQFCGGEELKLWKQPMLDILKRFARDLGCEGIESTGRPGWAKIFENDGYKATWVTYELPIDMEKDNG
jgi:hypothetical protein